MPDDSNLGGSLFDPFNSFIFSSDPKSGALSYPELVTRRKLAMALATRNRKFPSTIGEGLTYLGESIADRIESEKLAKAEAAQKEYEQGRTALPPDPAAPGPQLPPRSAAPLASSDVPSDVLAYLPQEEENTGAVKNLTGAVTPTTEQPSAGVIPPLPEGRTATPPGAGKAPRVPVMLSRADPNAGIDDWMARIKRNESGGAKGDQYQLIGQRSRRGDYPYGAYQVMGVNVGPWTKQHYGQELTPEEFLNNPEAQDAVARGQGGMYLSKYGPERAAAAWFAGERGMDDPNRKDTLGTHVSEYVRRFNRPLPATRADLAGSLAAQAPTSATASDEGDAQQLADGTGVPPQQPRVQLAAADTGTMSDAPSPMGSVVDAGVGAATAPRAAIADTVAKQQVAQAGGAPIGAAPPAVPPTMPMVTPSQIPKAPAQREEPTPAGPEPTFNSVVTPREQQLLNHHMANASDPRLPPEIQRNELLKHNELKAQIQDRYTKLWTRWHEQSKLEETTRLGREKSDLEITKMRGEAEDAATERVLAARFGRKDYSVPLGEMAKKRDSIEMVSQAMEDNRVLMKALQEGVISGFGANLRLNASKLAAFAFNNGYASEQAANTEIMRALGGSAIREQLSKINTGPSSNVELSLAKMMSGRDPSLEPKTIIELLKKSNEYSARAINDFEDKRDYYLGGTRLERDFQTLSKPTAPSMYVSRLLENKDDPAARAAYDDRFGDGSAALEIERAKRRARRGE